MALPDYDPDTLTGDTVQVLRTLLANFSVAPLRSGKSVRDLMLTDYAGFRAAAMIVLREPMDIRGLRYLVTFLWTNDLLISILGDATLPKELSISISQIAAKVDPQFHIRLIRFLVTGMLEGREVEEKSANRLLEVLGAVSDGASVQAFLRQMIEHPNPRIRSKISLLVGQGERVGPAIRKVLGDPSEDARVRANAVEALWSNRNKEVVDLFCEMLDDPNNRVAGNAALGVYLAGDPRSIPAIRKMAASPDASVQHTAAWVMGKTQDPRFLPDLGRLLGQEHGPLRKAVFQSLMAIKNASTRRAKKLRLSLVITDVVHSGTGLTAVRLCISAPDGVEPPQILPTGFAVLLGGRPIEQFSCLDRRNPQICVAFLIPRKTDASDPLRVALTSVLTGCLAEKRATDRWLTMRYEAPEAAGNTPVFRMFGETMEQARGPETKKRFPVTLTANAQALRAEIESGSPRAEIATGVFEGINKIVSGLRPVRGPRYALVVIDQFDEMETEIFEAMSAIVRIAGVAINVISTVWNLQLETLCRASSGIFQTVHDVEAIAPAVRILNQSFKSEYVLEFASPEADGDGARVLSIQAYNDSAFGEASLEMEHNREFSPELVESDL